MDREVAREGTPEGIAVAVETEAAAVAAVAKDFPTRITAKWRVSRANLAGNCFSEFVSICVGGEVARRLTQPKEIAMTTTFKKRQKEMKRMDKARMKAERRAQKKLEPREDGSSVDVFDTRIEDLQPLALDDSSIPSERE